MVSLLLALGCAPTPAPRLPATRDTMALEWAIHRLSEEEITAWRPVIERWAVVGARTVRPAGNIADFVGWQAIRQLQTEPAAIPTIASLLYGRHEWIVARVLVAQGEPGCTALVAAAVPGSSAAETELISERDCARELDAADTEPARLLRAMRDGAQR